MKFIPKQNKKARLVGQALRRSLNISTQQANDAVAVMYGHARWATLCKAMLKGQPSRWDEEISPDMAKQRTSILVERLRQSLQLSADDAQRLIDQLKPTSTALSQPLVLHVIHSPPSTVKPADDLQAIADAFALQGNQQNTDLIMTKLLNEAMAAAGDETADGFDASTLSERMRVSQPIDPGAFFDILQSLGWPLDESSFEVDYVYGEPSFFAESSLGHVPVYLTSLAMTPNADDSLAFDVMAVMEEDNCTNMETERFILIWGQPQVKVIDDNPYSYWGRLWENGQWRDFLFNGEMSSADKLFAMNPADQDINQPTTMQADPEHALATSVVVFLQGLQGQRDKITMGKIQTPSGWDMLVPALN